MEKIKRAYYYFFYKMYKFIEYTSEGLGAFLTDFKACIITGVLEIWVYLSLINYYTIITKVWFNLSLKEPIIYIPLIIIIILNYLAFIHTDIWKEYHKEFDQLPKEVNRRGSWIVLGITLFIITNFIFSLYLLYKIKNG